MIRRKYKAIESKVIIPYIDGEILLPHPFTSPVTRYLAVNREFFGIVQRQGYLWIHTYMNSCNATTIKNIIECETKQDDNYLFSLFLRRGQFDNRKLITSTILYNPDDTPSSLMRVTNGIAIGYNVITKSFTWLYDLEIYRFVAGARVNIYIPHEYVIPSNKFTTDPEEYNSRYIQALAC